MHSETPGESTSDPTYCIKERRSDETVSYMSAIILRWASKVLSIWWRAANARTFAAGWATDDSLLPNQQTLPVARRRSKHRPESITSRHGKIRYALTLGRASYKTNRSGSQSVPSRGSGWVRSSRLSGAVRKGARHYNEGSIAITSAPPLN